MTEPADEHIDTVAALRERLDLLPGDTPVAIAIEGCYASVGRVLVEHGVAYLYARYERTAAEERERSEKKQ